MGVVRFGRSVETAAMWCKRCQQDVPAIAGGEGRIVCARCATRLQSSPSGFSEEPSTATRSSEASGRASDFHERPPELVEPWLLDAQLHDAEQLLARVAPGLNSATLRRVDPIGPGSSPANSRAGENSVAASSSQSDATQATSASPLAWLFLALGTAALVCGGMLTGWSFVSGRAALWNLGLPILLGGQAALLVGIVLQVERMWRNSRAASARLAHVDRELSELHETTTLLGTTYGAGSSAFYSHLAEGASPHLLMADLKSQIDLLAVKMSRQR